jgi:hypothetical protein
MIINKPKSMFESFTNKRKYRCPNILIQKDKHIFLYNSELAPVPGVNPIMFDNLNEYVEFTKWQRSQGIRCPSLFLQHSYNAQGRSVYKVRPSPTELQGGLEEGRVTENRTLAPQTLLLNATRNNPPYNNDQYPGYDPHNQYIGQSTPLDKITNEGEEITPNPMDTNWGGDKYTNQLIKQGYYKGNKVKLAVA